MKYITLIFLLFAFSFADELRSLTNKGISAFKKGDFITALEHFSTAVEKFPMSNEARFNKGLALGASGSAKEAETMLSSVRFNNDKQNAEVLFSRARILEAVGDAAIQNEQPNIGEAKKAYEKSRSLYAQSLDLITDKKARQRTVNNIEILTQKIKNLPEQDPNQDRENKDENNDNQDKNDENKNEQDKKDGEENKEEQNQDENQENNEQNEEEKEQEQQRQEQDEQIEDAIRLLEHYSDDAKELNKPPVQKAVPAVDGKDW
jgi:cobalamin biosynthesis protein CobT